MDEEKVQIFIKILMPLILILCPLAVIIIGTATYHELEKGHRDGVTGALAVMAICLASFLGAILYCRKQYGWFQKK